MLHKLIIPVLNRNGPLSDCLRSIHASAEHCGIGSYECIICDGGSREVWKPGRKERVVNCHGLEPIRLLPGEVAPFNKPRCLNAGIDAVEDKECLLTFLDADAVVGDSFMMRGVDGIVGEIDRTMYRVRTCQPEKPRKPWEQSPIAYEAYGHPDDDWAERMMAKPPTFPDPAVSPQGNSQFSIRKSVLNETRWNERYFGRSYEDLWMMRELWNRGLNRTYIWVTEQNAMWHRKTDPSPHFCAGRWANRNYRMYHGKRTNWVIGTGTALLERFQMALTAIPGSSAATCRFVERDDFAENVFQEVIPETDRFIFLDRSRMMGFAGCPTLIVDGAIALKERWPEVLGWIGLNGEGRELP
jgi:hypothetical protein